MFPFEPNEYVDEYPHIFVQDFQNNYASSSSSSSSLSSHGFFNSTEFHHLQMHQPTPYQQEVINRVPEARSHDLEKRDDDDDQGLKFTLWKNEDQSEIKWMSSKMRLMRKMKKSDNGKEMISSRTTTTTTTTTATNSAKFEDHQKQASPSSVTDHFSLTNNASSRYDNHHPPIRVCADCNTTKTPLWRSGPKGPKSLCNACGIRQRKARRAMAAAAVAAENGKSVPLSGTTTPMKIKVQNKEFKKRCKPTRVTAESSNNNNAAAAQQKKNAGLEEFLFNLSKSLAIHRVFPQEEKDAAILLMALSCNRVHG